MGTKSAIKEQTSLNVREPKKYNVIMLNDDFTTMDFVVKILIEVFKKSRPDAEALMLKVHNNGRAVVGQYSYDIAASKINRAMSRAQKEGFPFRLKIEEA